MPRFFSELTNFISPSFGEPFSTMNCLTSGSAFSSDSLLGAGNGDVVFRLFCGASTFACVLAFASASAFVRLGCVGLSKVVLAGSATLIGTDIALGFIGGSPSLNVFMFAFAFV